MFSRLQPVQTIPPLEQTPEQHYIQNYIFTIELIKQTNLRELKRKLLNTLTYFQQQYNDCNDVISSWNDLFRDELISMHELLTTIAQRLSAAYAGRTRGCEINPLHGYILLALYPENSFINTTAAGSEVFNFIKAMDIYNSKLEDVNNMVNIVINEYQAWYQLRKRELWFGYNLLHGENGQERAKLFKTNILKQFNCGNLLGMLIAIYQSLNYKYGWWVDYTPLYWTRLSSARCHVHSFNGFLLRLMTRGHSTQLTTALIPPYYSQGIILSLRNRWLQWLEQLFFTKLRIDRRFLDAYTL